MSQNELIRNIVSFLLFHHIMYKYVLSCYGDYLHDPPSTITAVPDLIAYVPINPQLSSTLHVLNNSPTNVFLFSEYGNNVFLTTNLNHFYFIQVINIVLISIIPTG